MDRSGAACEHEAGYTDGGRAMTTATTTAIGLTRGGCNSSRQEMAQFVVIKSVGEIRLPAGGRRKGEDLYSELTG